MAMKPSLQPTLGQHLRLTPQLRQAIHLLQLSATELEQEVAAAVESNPLLDWDDTPPPGAPDAPADPVPATDTASGPPDDWDTSPDPWAGGPGATGDPDADEGPRDPPAAGETLHDHLLWQLHLGPMSARDRMIGVSLVDAIDDDGYLREPLAVVAEATALQPPPMEHEVRAVLHRLQHFDPPGVGARDLGECLCLQLDTLPGDTPGRALATRLAMEWLPQLPRMGIEGLAAALGEPRDAVASAVELLRGLDPRPGARFGELPAGTYVAPDVVVWRDGAAWRAALAPGAQPRVALHAGYAAMAAGATGADGGYLRERLQEARWLLKGLQARGETLLKVMDTLLREQAAFLEFGEQALRPLTLREVAAAIGMHESTVSRAVARKYARTPRGTLPLRAFFASGIDTGEGEASSTAIQALLRRMVEAEDPRHPLSDAKLADALKAAGAPVARRTVAKYREILGIPSSSDRIRMA